MKEKKDTERLISVSSASLVGAQRINYTYYLCAVVNQHFFIFFDLITVLVLVVVLVRYCKVKNERTRIQPSNTTQTVDAWWMKMMKGTQREYVQYPLVVGTTKELAISNE
jgi:hypothetical protein